MKKWLVLLSLLLLTACMGQGVTYDLNTSLHAVLLSDLHFSVSPNVVSSIVPAMPYSRAFTEALFAEVIAAHPDVLIIDGDNTNSGSREDMEELAKLLSQVREAEIPIVMVSGNHDFNLCTPQEYEAVYMPQLFVQERDHASLSYRTDISGVRLLAMDDSSADRGMDGYYSGETLAWVKKQLDDARKNNMRVIFLTHHPLLNERALTDNNGKKEMIRLLNQYDVRLCISGHTHGEAVLKKENLNEIILGMPLSGNHDIGTLDLEKGHVRYRAEPAKLSVYGSEGLAEKIEEADRLYDSGLSEAFESIFDKENITGEKRREILRLTNRFMKEYSEGRLRETAPEIKDDPYYPDMIEALWDYNYGPWIESVLDNPPENGRALEFDW